MLVRLEGKAFVGSVDVGRVLLNNQLLVVAISRGSL